MPKHDARAAPQQPNCRRQRGSTRVENKMRSASDAEAAAGSVQREDDDVTAKGVVEMISVVPPQSSDSGSHEPEAAHCVYS